MPVSVLLCLPLVAQGYGLPAPFAPGDPPPVQFEYGRLLAPGVEPGDEYSAVAVAGDVAVVGAYGDDERGLDCGAAYFYQRLDPGTPADPTDDIWVPIDKVTASDARPGDRLGKAVLFGSTAVISAPRGDGAAPDSGAAYVFERDDHGTPDDPFDDHWIETDKLFAARGATGDEFLGAALYGDTLLCTARLERHGGAVYVFERHGGGWICTTTLTSRDLDPRSPGASGDQFGVSAALAGDTALIGAWLDGQATGAAYVFERTLQGWVQVAKLSGHDVNLNDWFGFRVALSGDRAAVSGLRALGSGAVYVFERRESGVPGDRSDDVWEETARLRSSNAHASNFGTDVALAGDVLAVGASFESGCGAGSSGTAYVYRHTAGAWHAVARLCPAVVSSTHKFADSLALSGDTLLCNAAWDPGGGAVYAFAVTPGANHPPELVGPRGARNALVEHASHLRWTAWDADGDALDVDVLAAPPGATHVPSLPTQGRDVTLDFTWTPELADLGEHALAYVVSDGRAASTTRLELGVSRRACLDFETEDDFFTPLLNGQEITAAANFGRLVTLEGQSAHGLGLAVFDSLVTGANRFVADVDLQVDLGRILILQERPEQSLPGIYDLPNDDIFGGTLGASFVQPARLLSIDLIDVDDAEAQDVTLTLLDGAGRTRVYRVPPGWTEDRVLNGPPGYRTLDLTSLAPQPGFRSTTTAAEEPGFGAGSVVLLRIDASGSCGFDNLVFEPGRLPLRPTAAGRGVRPGRRHPAGGRHEAERTRLR